MKRKKTGTIILLMASWLLLIGAKLLDVQLKGADRPLVDLSVMLKSGGNYLPNGMIVNTESDPDADPSSPESGTVSAYAGDELIIRVKNATVFLNEQPALGKPYTTLIDEAYSGGRKKLTLIDDYAEYKTFRSVKEYLDSEGIRYEEQAR
ncbi:MAG: hypothetical protein K6F53_01090 [Lachnospiraceae bacterium]|nr:hypothetical protein [Lachnospiraceae bacterium]